MLPKKYRLTGQQNFKKIAKKGKCFFIKELKIKYLKNNLTHPRFAFVVSSKIDKRATVRNKIKRRLREIVFQNLKKIKKNLDFLIIVKPEVKNLDFWQMKEILEKAFKKIEMIE